MRYLGVYIKLNSAQQTLNIEGKGYCQETLFKRLFLIIL